MTHTIACREDFINSPENCQFGKFRRKRRGAPRLLCTRTRVASIAAIPHIRFHMCQKIWFALARDHESWPGGLSADPCGGRRWRAATNRGGLPSGSAAGTARRRFDLKVALQTQRFRFVIPFPADLRQTSPRHSNLRFSASPASRMLAFARHENACVAGFTNITHLCST